jgi:hypothetical protein
MLFRSKKIKQKGTATRAFIFQQNGFLLQKETRLKEKYLSFGPQKKGTQRKAPTNNFLTSKQPRQQALTKLSGFCSKIRAIFCQPLSALSLSLT